MVIIVVVVMDRCTIVVLLCVCQWLLRVMCKVRHVLLILIVAVASLMGHWVVVVAVETTVVHWAVIEVFRVVVSVMVTVLHLVMCVMQVSIVMLSNVLWLVMMIIDRQVVMHIFVMVHMMVSVHVLNIEVIIVVVVSNLLVNNWLDVFNNVVHDLVNDWLVDDFVMHDSFMMRRVMHDTLSHFRI